MRIITLWTALLAVSACVAESPQTVDSPSRRWAKEGPGGTPEFSRHVLPLLGKLGCSNRACHGSFKGQNGFRLSLFGSDPAADHKALLEDRIDRKRPQESLALLKPTRTVYHKGGERMRVGSWQYFLFLAWIQGGATYNPAKDARVSRLVVEPEEFVLAKKGDRARIRVIAHFNDGSTEDVTPLTIFESKDDSIATVSDDGTISALRPGVSAVIATYGGEVRSSQVLVPRPDDGIAMPAFPPSNHLDVLVHRQLKKLNIHPSELASDEMFLRRVFLDVIGKLPRPDEVRAFLADTRPDKRSRLIDALLERPEYARYWGMIFSDITGNQGINPHAQVSHMWQSWLEDKLAKNWSYDKIVGGILTATSLEGRARAELVAEIESIRKSIGSSEENPGIASNRYDEEGIYAKRNTLDLYWLRIPNRNPDRVALHTATAFLGVRLDCAQCHRHPFDRWTTADFEHFQSFFRVSEFRYAPTGGPLPKGAIAFGRDEMYVGLNTRYKNLIKRYPPKVLGGIEIPYQLGDPDPRIALWEWMKSPDNPYFAPSLVNRIWALYFGVGLVEPVEDFSRGNPASNPVLLSWLAREFIHQGFDLKWLHRQILTSRAYQLSWVPNDSNRHDRRNASHALFRRLSAEVLTDALGDVTGMAYSFRFAPKGSRAVGYAPSLRVPYVLELFGRGPRKQTCGACERSEEPALSQALYLLTDAEIQERMSVANGRLASLKKVAGDREVVEELYLASLSRFPTTGELEESLGYRKECESREAWMEDMLWSLVNVREFIFNH